MFIGRTDVETETPIFWLIKDVLKCLEDFITDSKKYIPSLIADSLEKTLMLGKIEDRRRRG